MPETKDGFVLDDKALTAIRDKKKLVEYAIGLSKKIKEEGSKGGKNDRRQ